jgi:CIC family chloride channel protein
MDSLESKGYGRQSRVIEFLKSLGFREDMYLIIVAAVVGISAGLGAVIFGAMVRGAGKFFFEILPGYFDGNVWIYLIALVPAVGALIVGLIQTYIVPEARGPGVPSVVFAIVRQGGFIPLRVGIAKAITSAISIGSGGSAGTEAPIIQIGSTIGSAAGQLLKVSSQHMPVIVAAGAAAGLGAIFNAPIAGVLFALEIFLQDISYKTFTPVVIASVAAASIARMITQQNIAMFAIPASLSTHTYHWYELINFAILGIVCGLACVLFMRVFFKSGELFGRLGLPAFVKPAIGGLLLGIIGMAMLFTMQKPGYQPAIFGNGYSWIQRLMDPATYGSSVEGLRVSGLILLGLFAMKMISTSLTLGSGGAGGEFGPALFLGAALGGSAGMCLQAVGFPISSPTDYAIVGMAGVIAGTIHAPLTAILLLFEITGDYAMILPIMIAAVLSTTCAQLIDRHSIYTKAIAKMGIRMGGLADLTILRKVTLQQLPLRSSPVIHASDLMEKLLACAQESELHDFIVTDSDGRYQSMVTGEDIRTALLCPDAIPLLVVGELAKPYPTLLLFDTLETAINKFSMHNIESLAIVASADDPHVIGVITRSDLMRMYQHTLSAMRK